MIAVTSPLTGELLREVPIRTAEEVAAAVTRARGAFSTWSEAGITGRSRVMKRVLERMVAGRERLIDELIVETGKVRGDALQEVLLFLDTFRFYLGNAREFLADEVVTPHIMKNKRGVVTRKARGVVGLISPWNFPIDLGFGDRSEHGQAKRAIQKLLRALQPLARIVGPKDRFMMHRSVNAFTGNP